MPNAPHISTSISKLGTIPAINLPAGLSCRPDAPCFKDCYARKGRFRFENVRQSVANNFACWKENPFLYRTTVQWYAMQNRFFRWHSSGDVPDESYLSMMFDVAEAVPSCQFLAFTKRYEWVNSLLARRAKPVNLSLVLSAWGKWIPQNPFDLPVAYVKLKSGEGSDLIPADAIPCSGSCANCVSGKVCCWTLERGQSVVFNQH